VPLVNELLALPFSVKIATKDYHPTDHISFASNHPAPDNIPFVSIITIKNPLNPEEVQETRLWPDHCVQGTKGAELLQELDVGKIHHVVEKGQDKRVEMYSAFADPFLNPTVSRSRLAQILHDAGVTDVYVAGLAADYCVKYTALDARREGFKTWVVADATRAVDPSTLAKVYAQYDQVGINVVDKSHVTLEG
jgi:nicotinamidase-related amidase